MNKYGTSVLIVFVQVLFYANVMFVSYNDSSINEKVAIKLWLMYQWQNTYGMNFAYVNGLIKADNLRPCGFRWLVIS